MAQRHSAPVRSVWHSPSAIHCAVRLTRYCGLLACRTIACAEARHGAPAQQEAQGWRNSRYGGVFGVSRMNRVAVMTSSSFQIDAPRPVSKAAFWAACVIISIGESGALSLGRRTTCPHPTRMGVFASILASASCISFTILPKHSQPLRAITLAPAKDKARAPQDASALLQGEKGMRIVAQVFAWQAWVEKTGRITDRIDEGGMR